MAPFRTKKCRKLPFPQDFTIKPTTICDDIVFCLLDESAFVKDFETATQAVFRAENELPPPQGFAIKPMVIRHGIVCLPDEAFLKVL